MQTRRRQKIMAVAIKKIDEQRQHILHYRADRAGAERWIVTEPSEQLRQKQTDSGGYTACGKQRDCHRCS